MSARSIRTPMRWPLIAGAFVAAAHASAANVEWAGNRFVYATNGSSVADALNVFAAGQHIPLRVDGHVAGVVSGRFAMPPERFLDTLSASYGLVWYYDGAVLQVSLASGQTRIAIRPNFLSAGALRDALVRAGLTDAHFPLQVDDAVHTVIAHGPATYVERIRLAARRFEGDARKRVRTAVRVFRLSVATAADETRVVDGRTVTVPGAATLLRQRFAPRAPGGALGSADAAAHAPQVVEFEAPLPIVEADAATNSILIRDKPERIDADGELISQLDVRPRLVSVQTWVVDVDADALAGLLGALPPALAASAAAGARTGFGVAADGGRALLARLAALEQARRAQLEVSQTALTTDRSPAVIDRHEVRLAQREDDDTPEDAALDLWLSVKPTVDAASTGRIGLRVELGRGDDGQRHRTVDESVAPGECLVIAAPAQAIADSHARQRLVLLIPRIAA